MIKILAAFKFKSLLLQFFFLFFKWRVGEGGCKYQLKQQKPIVLLHP